MRLCKDCKYFFRSEQLCTREPTVNLVTGLPKFKSANYERAEPKVDEECGPEGEYWEPKECQNLTQISPVLNASSGENTSTITNQVEENTNRQLFSRLHRFLEGLWDSTPFWTAVLYMIGGMYTALFLLLLWLRLSSPVD